WPAVFERVAGDLADQRLHLLEQWRRLLALHEQWQQEQGAGLADLETGARQLQQREQRLVVQEQALAAGLADLQARQEALSQARGSLEGWHARLRAREADWESERVALLVEVQVREETAAVQARRLENLRQRWGRRYRKEVEELNASRARCEE